MTSSPSIALRTTGLTVQFGGIVALDSVDLTLHSGARYGVLGPNGAGKTTLFNAISGLIQPTAGQIDLLGMDVTRKKPHERARLGLGRTFQITSLFPTLTVRENVAMATRIESECDAVWWRPSTDETGANEDADRLLQEIGLASMADRSVASLGYGEQRQLEIAVTLATRPKILLLDEPTAGLSATETLIVVALVQALPSELTILIIEHDLDVIFTITDELSVLRNGECIASGSTDEIRADPLVREVYLGA